MTGLKKICFFLFFWGWPVVGVFLACHMLLKTTQAEGTSLQRHKPNAKIDRNSYLFLPRFGELPQTSTVLQRKNRAPGLFRFYLEGMTFAAQSGIVEKKPCNKDSYETMKQPIIRILVFLSIRGFQTTQSNGDYDHLM